MKAIALILACLLAAQVLAQSYPGTTVISSEKIDGFEQIFLDTPSFLSAMQHSFYHRDLIVYGGGMSRMINDANFQAMATMSPAGSTTWNVNFIEVQYFADASNQTWAIGTVGPTPGAAVQPQGYEVLVAITGGAYPMVPKIVSLGNHAGFVPTAVRVDSSFSNGANIIVAYFLGYVPGSSPAGQNWGVVRTTTDLTNLATAFSFNNATDIAILNSFPFYSQENDQNYIVHDWQWSALFIVDNYADKMYAFALPANLSVPLTSANLGSYDISTLTVNYQISSVAYDNTKANIYIGLSTNGMGTGSVLTIGMNPGSIGPNWAPIPPGTNMVTLPTNFSNPKAMAVDTDSGSLYVAPNGGSAIVRISLNNFLITGYQNLPEYLHRTWLAAEGGEHVYFATNEQHSKVFRVNKTDFCDKPCPYWGYCTNGKCVCGEFFAMLDGYCQPKSYVRERNIYHRVHGGETALGILFMFAVIAAVAGWFMFWRTRRHTVSYQPVL